MAECVLLATALAPELRRRFLVTHFFNPPRQMRLVEGVVPCAETDAAVVAGMATFIRRRPRLAAPHSRSISGTPN